MSPPNFLLLVALLFCTPLATFGLSFRGTVTQVITRSDDPLYYPGQTFIGYYQYDSPTIDGTFFTDQFDPPLTPKPPGAIASLSGTIYSPFVNTVYIPAFGEYTLSYGPGGSWRTFAGTVNEGVLTVSDGVVSEFLWTWEYGGFYMYMGTESFFTYNFYDTFARPFPRVVGTVTFGLPTRVSEFGVPIRVSEWGSSFWLLAAAVVLQVSISRHSPTDRAVSKQAT